MATTTTAEPKVISVEGDQCVLLRDIGWKSYRTMLRLRGECSIPKMIYLDGSLLLVSPTSVRAFLKKRLAAFVHEVIAWVSRPAPSSETEWYEDLRRWVNDVLAPRRAGPQA